MGDNKAGKGERRGIMTVVFVCHHVFLCRLRSVAAEAPCQIMEGERLSLLLSIRIGLKTRNHRTRGKVIGGILFEDLESKCEAILHVQSLCLGFLL